VPTSSNRQVVLTPVSRRALFAACIGNAVEWYDFAVYGALGTIIVAVFFPLDDHILLSAFALYGAAFLVRPIGAVVLGRRGDSHGRQRVLVLVIALMTGATAVVGVLPGYAAIGVAAPLTLVLLRIAQGLAAGGELGVAAVFLVEHSPPGRRGLYGAWHTATLALGLASGLVVAGLLAQLPGDLAGGAWRVAFLLALPLGLVGVYMRRHVSETPGFVELERADALANGPIRALWTRHRHGLHAGFAVIAVGSLTFNTFFVFRPNHLAHTTSMTLPTALLTAVAGLVAAAFAALTLGRLSDRVGRRAVVLGSITALVLCAVPMSLAAHSGSLLALTVAQVLAGIGIGGTLSVSMLAEMFPGDLRATGLGLTAGLATAVVGGTAPLVDQVLFLATGFEEAPALYVVIVGCLALATARSWPETAFQDLDQPSLD
jgi:MHS family proline/betaine transporter-like MFS transporter